MKDSESKEYRDNEASKRFKQMNESHEKLDLENFGDDLYVVYREMKQEIKKNFPKVDYEKPKK